ncbi:MAG: putative RNA methylase family UPF0020-domain-containing protein [Monoraphidium minutum]|nr:MAG: putative RNA methylase family UPF0020-domain-containing protein [Monoraphidium minutum]
MLLPSARTSWLAGNMLRCGRRAPFSQAPAAAAAFNSARGSGSGGDDSGGHSGEDDWDGPRQGRRYQQQWRRGGGRGGRGGGGGGDLAQMYQRRRAEEAGSGADDWGRGPRRRRDERDAPVAPPLPPPRQHKYSYVVTCHPGLEDAVVGELQAPRIGAESIESKEPGRVKFGADSQDVAYRAAIWLRSAVRVLQLIALEPLDPYREAGDTIYEATRQLLDWQLLLPPGGTVGVTSQVWGCSNVTNSQLVARRVRDAVCDAVRDARGARPAPPGEAGADLPLHAALLRDTLHLYRDLGGGSLHRRGYRQGSAIHKAALNEAAAAGLLLLAGWQRRCLEGDAVLADPMCGSGTFLIEAALIATDAAPGLLRRRGWPLERWHDFEAAAWRAAVEGAEGARRRWGGAILGNDIHDGALQLAKAGAAAAGVPRLITLSQGGCGKWCPGRTPTMVATNPPWGGRLLGDGGGGGGARAPRGGRDGRGHRGWDDGVDWDGRDGGGGGGGRDGDRGGGGGGDADPELERAWVDLSRFVKGACPGADAWVLCGAPGLSSALGMRSFKKRSVTVGGVKAAWLGYAVRAREGEGEPERGGGGYGREGAAERGGEGRNVRQGEGYAARAREGEPARGGGGDAAEGGREGAAEHGHAGHDVSGRDWAAERGGEGRGARGHERAAERWREGAAERGGEGHATRGRERAAERGDGAAWQHVTGMRRVRPASE